MISAEYVRTIYPSKPSQMNTSGYMVCEYKCCDDKIKTLTKQISPGDKFTGFGYYLPTAHIKYEIEGSWESGKYGEQLKISQIKSGRLDDIESIKSYLISDMVSGIGPRTAELICDRFGTDSLRIIEEEPEKLLEIRGITKTRLEKITKSYSGTKDTAELVGFLAPLGVSPSKIMKIHKKFKGNAVQIAKEHPFKLCSIPGISYNFASSISESQGLPKNAPERCQAALLYILELNEISGNLYMPVDDWLNRSIALIDCPDVSTEDVIRYSKGLMTDKKVKYTVNPENKDQKVVYRYSAVLAENTAAKEIMRVLDSKEESISFDANKAIDEYEESKDIHLAPEQRMAVETALANKVSIITGGPGTGKTTIIGALYDIYKEFHPESKILLCAPTGTAARKMAASTGVAAYTIHKAVGITVTEEDEMETMSTGTTLDVDFVIVDEYSMADVYLTATLFSAVPSNARIVLIGDVDQLPSVGPGAVLSEMIASTCIPIAKLVKIYRQKNGSKVAVNAALIRMGRTDLQYDNESFVFIPASTPEESAEIIRRQYLDEVAINGVDNVTILSPFKRKTASCSNELNRTIHDLVNPPSRTKQECVINGTTYRIGDKVMQIRNNADVSNGDIGYITNINSGRGEVSVDFGFKEVTYTSADLALIEHAYATSVHKSQGAEYEVVIVNILNAHKIMLWRNLIYTAITRAKRKVIIVGQKEAVETAIQSSTNKECKRNTLLAVRIRYMS